MQRHRDRIKVVVEEVRVGVLGDLCRYVSEQALQRQHVDPRRHRQAGARVPQIVRRDRLHSRLFHRADEPPVGRLRTRQIPAVAPANTRSPGALSLHCRDRSSRTNSGTGTERALRPLVGPTAWRAPSWTAFCDTVSRLHRNSTSRTRSATATRAYCQPIDPGTPLRGLGHPGGYPAP